MGRPNRRTTLRDTGSVASRLCVDATGVTMRLDAITRPLFTSAVVYTMQFR